MVDVLVLLVKVGNFSEYIVIHVVLTLTVDVLMVKPTCREVSGMIYFVLL